MAIVMLAVPVTACHAEVSKVGPSEVCLNAEMTYTITAKAVLDTSKYYVKVVDYLPKNVTYLSSTSGGVYDPSKHTVTWIYGTVANNNVTQLKVTVRPTSVSPPVLVNDARSWVRKKTTDSWTAEEKIKTKVTTTVKDCKATVTITGDPTVCTTCDETSYDIGFGYTGVAGSYGRVVYTLPAGVSYLGSTSGGVYDGVARTVSWETGPLGAVETKGPYQVTINPKGGPAVLTNTADAYLKPTVSGSWTSAASATNQWTTELVPCAPEFPATFIPAGMIIGLFGVVLYARNNRED